ncbi:ATP-binding cassette domain-containing protein [Gorillibacterium massiliense]|uniref:ATP-binding cassette domain-containing protein n=1 Tax=Gorillibacterium massiliense TaxID=1280390 RepID=UPI0004ACC8AC|nr:ATP-binding cassette domain-containing protein [Gorillibacterium massiliense]
MNSHSERRSDGRTILLSAEGLEVDKNGKRVIRGLNFHLEQGEMRFVIGPFGAGKTTFLETISGKYKPANGRLLFQGIVDLGTFYDQQIVRMGVVLQGQSPSIFTSLNSFENLFLAMRQNRRLLHSLLVRTTSEQSERIVSTLKLIGLDKRAGLPAGRLSHGEKQRLEIGMQLMHDPDLLLIDEPSSGLTSAEKENMREMLLKINEKKTVLVCERDLEFVRSFGKPVTVIQHGTVLEEGPADEVLGNERIYALCAGIKTTEDNLPA